MEDILDIIRDHFRNYLRIDGWEASEPFTDETNALVITTPEGVDFTLTIRQG